MKKIIGIVKPFNAYQTLAVFEDGEKIATYQTTMNDLIPYLFKIMEENDTYQLDITGPKTYVAGIKEQIETAGITKYSTNKLEINII